MRVKLRAVAICATTMALINLCVMLGMGTLATAPLGPQAFPIGIAAAIVASAVGGVLVSIIAPQRATITAPSSSLVIIYAAAAAHLVAQGGGELTLMELWAMLSLMVVVTGMLLIVMGTLRLSDVVTYMPLPVSIGFVSGIGLLVIISQLPSLLGGRPGTFAQAMEALQQFKPGAVAVGALAAWLTFRAPCSRIASYGPLAALTAGAALHHILVWTSGEDVVGPTLGGVEIASSVQWTWQALPSSFSGEWLGDTLVLVLPFAFVLAFQAAMNGAFTSASMSSGGGKRRSIYQVLQAQGLANIVCGCLGAFPVSTNAPLSLIAARHGPGPRLPVASGMVVIAAGVLASGLLGLLPLASFAGVLIVSGALMIDVRIWHLLRSLYAVRTRVDTAMNLLVIATVAGLLVTGRVGEGIVAGVALELAHLGLRAVRLRRSGALAASAQPDAGTHDASLRERGVEIVRVQGPLFFGNVPNFASRLADLPGSTRHLVMDFSRATHVDLTAIHTLHRELNGLAANGVQARFSGIRPGEGPLGHLPPQGPLIAGRPCFTHLSGAVDSIGPLETPTRAAADTPDPGEPPPVSHESIPRTADAGETLAPDAGYRVAR
jgi:sulfate permease, SulP family